MERDDGVCLSGYGERVSCFYSETRKILFFDVVPVDLYYTRRYTRIKVVDTRYSRNS